MRGNELPVSATKVKATNIMKLVTPKGAAKCEPLFNKPASDVMAPKAGLLNTCSC